MWLVLFEDSHWRCACVGNTRNGTKVLPDEVQSIVVAVGFEEYSEVPVSEEAVRSFNHHALHRVVGHL